MRLFSRLEVGLKIVDKWIDDTLTQIELRTNISASPPLKVYTGPGGVHLSCAIPAGTRIAKTGASGIPAATSTTMGKADVTLFDVDPATGAYTSQNITDAGYNLSKTKVGNNVMVIQVKVGSIWATVWEDC